MIKGAGLGLAALAAVALGVVIFGQRVDVMGPDGPFAVALKDAFPEASIHRTEMRFDEETTPLGATLHLPAMLIHPTGSADDPFFQLSSQFGGKKQVLSGVEMGERLDRLVAAALPDDVVRCHTYQVGDISPEQGDSFKTRTLHIHLNPGC